MSNTVSTDLAKRLASAGLKWEPKQTDLVDWKGSLGVVTRAGGLFDCRIYFFDGATTSHGERVAWLDFDVPSGGLLWLPTGDQCLEVIRSQGPYPAVAAYPESGAGPAHWGAWVSDRADECAVGLQEGDKPAEAAGLALLAILEGEKGVQP